MGYKISSFIKIDILKVAWYLVTALSLWCHKVAHMKKELLIWLYIEKKTSEMIIVNIE